MPTMMAVFPSGTCVHPCQSVDVVFCPPDEPVTGLSAYAQIFH